MNSDNKDVWTNFWRARKQFFECLCAAEKVDYAVMVARESIEMGKCVSIEIPQRVINGSTGFINLCDGLDACKLMRELSSTLNLSAVTSFSK